MKVCHCALPAMTGNTDCCKHCGNNDFNENTVTPYGKDIWSNTDIHYIPTDGPNNPLIEDDWKNHLDRLLKVMESARENDWTKALEQVTDDEIKEKENEMKIINGKHIYVKPDSTNNEMKEKYMIALESVDEEGLWMLIEYDSKEKMIEWIKCKPALNRKFKIFKELELDVR